MATRVMVMAGGTGGHVFPALAVAECLRRRGCEVSWLGTPDSFEARTVPGRGFVLDTVDSFRLRGQGIATLLQTPFRLLRAMVQALRVLRRRRPDMVLGMGGFAAGPGGLVSRLLGLPLVIHEQNAIPGMTNRWLARIASRVLSAFPGTFGNRPVTVVGNPVRAAILGLPAPGERLAGRNGPLHLLVLGGSLGAQVLNENVAPALAIVAADLAIEVRHQAGRGKLDATRSAYAAAGIAGELTEFVDDMDTAYAWADLVLCRSGALTVTELMNVGLASILVPFPHAVDDHQTANARYLVEQDAARLLPQDALTPEALAANLRELCADRGLLRGMAARAHALARPDATERVADICLEVAS